MVFHAIYILDATIVVLCLYIAHKLYRTRACYHSQRPSTRGYILMNQVTHSRLLPRAARHSFTYPTFSFLVPLSKLESGSLDLLGGLLFRYGARWGTLLGLRSKGYLAEDTIGAVGKSIQRKLEELLESRGSNGKYIRDVWMMTMPSILGFEGINPLTVYFTYDEANTLLMTVLEVHNTFGEGHVYLLEVGRDEDANPPKNFDHQWTFPRRFFVSPFNDRSGFYTVAIRAPKFAASGQPSTARPCVRIHLHTEQPDSISSPGELKLLAILRAESMQTLTTSNALCMLVRMPLALFVTLLRIWYQAFVLHYYKRLNVFPRPEPYPHFSSPADRRTDYGGVIWQKETIFEWYARRRLCKFLQKRSEETGISIDLVHGDPSYPKLSFAPHASSIEHHASLGTRNLAIMITSHRFFTDCLSLPSAELILLLGRETEGIFDVSSRSAFVEVFTPTQSAVTSTRCLFGMSQFIRRFLIPGDLRDMVATLHPLDLSSPSTLVHAVDFLVICMLAMLNSIETRMYLLLGVQFVPDYEPWGMWQRARTVRNRLDRVRHH